MDVETEHDEEQFTDLSHIAGNGTEQERCTFDDVDRGNPQHGFDDDVWSLAADGIAVVLAWCWKAGPNEMQAAFRKFVTVSALVDPRLLGNLTFEQIGERVGCTKANISKVAREFRDEACDGIKFRRCRPDSGRAAMREARLRQIAEGRPRHTKSTLP